MRRALAILLLIAMSVVTASLVVGEVLSSPVNRSIGSAPEVLATESFVLQQTNDEPLSGWMVRGEPGAGVVLLLHGVRSNRHQMVARAVSLSREGYSVVLIDLPGHGESPADRISFGYQESMAVPIVMDHIRSVFPGEKVGVIGVSLGAASLILSRLKQQPDAIVLESMSPSIEEAIANRITMRLGPVGNLLTPLLLWQLPLRMDINPEQLRPIDRLSEWHSPVFILSGDADKHTTLAETRRLFQQANAPKQIWIVPGAGHVDLHRYATEMYEKRVYGFLNNHLRRKSDGENSPL